MRHFYHAIFLLGGLILFAYNGRAQKKLGIIGSSTPNCYLAESLDSCYVTRVQRYYSNAGTPITINNIANAGEDVYRGMPDSYVPPTGRRAPNTARNITAVIAENPDVVLVHYPSNGYEVFSIAEVMFCLRTIKQVANNAGKPCYIGTTQPRTDSAFNTPEVKRRMSDLKDSILNAFGTYAINFWDGLVNPADTALLPQYSLSDKTHLTSAGHKVVADKVIAKNMFATVLPLRFTSFSAYASNKEAHIQWTTAGEQDVTGYQIERSEDGSTFRVIQRTTARHLSGNNYSVTDPSPISAQSYYRIAAIGSNGQPSYTRQIRIAANSQSFQLQRITTNGLTVSAELHAAEKQPVTIQLVSNTGQVLAKLPYVLQEGFNNINLPASLPGNGLYFLRVFNSKSDTQIKSFVR